MKEKRTSHILALLRMQKASGKKTSSHILALSRKLASEKKMSSHILALLTWICCESFGKEKAFAHSCLVEKASEEKRRSHNLTLLRNLWRIK